MTTTRMMLMTSAGRANMKYRYPHYFFLLFFFFNEPSYIWRVPRYPDLNAPNSLQPSIFPVPLVAYRFRLLSRSTVNIEIFYFRSFRTCNLLLCACAFAWICGDIFFLSFLCYGTFLITLHEIFYSDFFFILAAKMFSSLRFFPRRNAVYTQILKLKRADIVECRK